MNFQITPLPLAQFTPLFALSDEELAARNIVRRVVDRYPGFPCRVSLEDAPLGETVLLLNYEHQPADTAYRSSHAIFVRERAHEATPAVNEIPEVLRRRLLSVRGFDARGLMAKADVVEGAALADAIADFFASHDVAYLHLHNAKPGCYAARVDRAV
jgi:hypothetical protein